MLFNSYIFILLFLPLCLLGYFGLNHFKQYKLAQVFLLGMSLWFYGYFNLSYLWIILASVGVNFCIYKLMEKVNTQGKRKMFLGLGLAFDIGILFYFKYFNFFIENVNALFKQDFNLLNIVMPLGISFFTFQQISFIVDAYRKEVPDYHILDYACFVTFFPQLIAGPIVSHNELVPQFGDVSKKKFQWENMAPGIYLFILGLGKKVLLADNLGNAVNFGVLSWPALNSLDLIIVMLAYTFQIYFDFSGYCDMAIGIGKMFNIDLPLNFNSPYHACTIEEFWNRWHMTLTRFLTKYIYIPLGGNRKGKVRTWINVFLVFLISGFWHGANWTFVLWGCLHGVASVMNKAFKKYIDKIPSAINWIVTFVFLNFTWLLFRVSSIETAYEIIKRIFTGGFGRCLYEFTQSVYMPEANKLVSVLFKVTGVDLSLLCPEWILITLLVISFVLIFLKRNAYEEMKRFKPTVIRMIFACIILVWSVISLSGVSTFLYFDF